VKPGQLTVHADRGCSMTPEPVDFRLADLGEAKPYSRPYASTYNPYSEVQCRTLKYRPDFPERFNAILQARTLGREFFEATSVKLVQKGDRVLPDLDRTYAAVAAFFFMALLFAPCSASCLRASRQRFRPHVPPRHLPLVVLFGEDGPDQAQDRLSVPKVPPRRPFVHG